MELLVVLGITAILMGILFIPLSRSIELSARGTAQIAAQDNVRQAMRRLRDDLSKAMVLYDQAPIRLWTYNAFGERDYRPTLLTASAPAYFDTANALIAFRLPRQRYFCELYDHYVTPADLDAIAPPPRLSDDAVLMDTCPRHPDSRVELRPTQPQQPDNRITAYFVALKNPGLVDTNAGTNTGNPVYDNVLLFRENFLDNNPADFSRSALNTYALYRVQFDPTLAPYSTFPTLPGGQANFFYDATPVSDGTRTMPRWMFWKEIANQIIDVETADVIRFIKNRDGGFSTHSLCTFQPAPVVGEIAQPNQEVVTNGVLRFQDVPPVQYELGYGNLVSAPNEQRLPIPDSATMSPASGVVGPRIEILAASGGLVYDSLNPAIRQRLVAFDPVSGNIILGHRRGEGVPPQYDWQPNSGAGGGIIGAPSMLGDFNIDLSADSLMHLGMPSSFGGARTYYDGIYGANTVPVRLVPGSETLEVRNTVTGEVFRMTRANNTRVPLEARADLEPNEYLINYDAGIIELPRSSVIDWSTVGQGGSDLQINLRYSFQTNERNDTVRVSYATKELQAATLGVVQYTRARAEALPFEVTERIALRNLRR